MKQYIPGLIALLLLVVTIFFIRQIGISSRSFTPQKQTLTVNTVTDLPAVWENHALRGRHLLIFDNHYLSSFDAPSVQLRTFIEGASRSPFRIVTNVVSDSYWPQLKKMVGIKQLYDRGDELFIMYSEMPLSVIPLSRLKDIGEPYVVHINLKNWTTPEGNSIMVLLDKSVRYDLTTILK